MPTHSQYDRHKRIPEPLMLSTCKNTFHSLRQYLGCDFIFGCTSRVLLYFRLYCSLANEVKFKFAIYILLTRISHTLILHSAFCVLHFLEPWVRVVAFMQHERSRTRAKDAFFQILYRLVSPAEALRFEFVHFNLWCTNGVAIGQIKHSLKLRILSGTKVFAKLFSKSVSSCCCVYATRTGLHSGNTSLFTNSA